MKIETGSVLFGEKNTDRIIIKNILFPAQNQSSNHWSVTDQGNEEIAKFAEYSKLQIMGTIHTHPFMMTTPSSIDLHQMNFLEKSEPNAISIIVNHADQSMSRIMRLNEFGKCEMNDCDELEPKVPDFHNSHYPH